MTKQALRDYYLVRRRKLNRAEWAAGSLQLCQEFFTSVDLSFVKVMHTYLPLERNNEPDTWMIIDRVKREFPQVGISVPRMNPDGSLENFYFEGFHQLRPNALGIPEPAGGVETPVEAVDLVVVPLLAFDKGGHRVGYGKGYYDRFLSLCNPRCLKIGLSFFDAAETIKDSSEHDIRLNLCITPGRVYTFDS